MTRRPGALLLVLWLVAFVAVAVLGARGMKRAAAVPPTDPTDSIYDDLDSVTVTMRGVRDALGRIR